jgi:phenylpropionate dioxygenase-like ring-hydroxylating dioxygenase large terminal subunit
MTTTAQRVAQRTPPPRDPSWRPQPTLPGGDYHLASVWERERERLFGREWVCVARDEELQSPGDYVVRDVAGESVIVVRDADGIVRALFNSCAHRGTRLLDEGAGHVRSGAIVCPYHAWTYDTRGRLLGTPNVHRDEGFDRASHPLSSLSLQVRAGFVFACMADEPPPIDAYFASNPEGDLIRSAERWHMQDLRTAHRIVYEVEANWKIVVENYSECLHCPGVHPELVQLVPLFRTGNVEDDDGAELADGAWAFTRSGTTNRPMLPGLHPEDRNVYLGNVLYPTLMLNLHADCVMSYRLEPRGERHTTIVSEFLFHPDTIARGDFDPSDVVEFWDLVSRQDWAVCERAQLGVTSKAYASGGVYPEKDRSVWDFNERYRRSMGPR